MDFFFFKQKTAYDLRIRDWMSDVCSSDLGRAWTTVDEVGAIRHAVEIRHKSFSTPEFVDLLRAHNVALVCADTVEWPLLMDVTADFIYCRLHGSQELYVSGYDDEALAVWARRVRAWAGGGRDVYRSEAGRVGTEWASTWRS